MMQALEEIFKYGGGIVALGTVIFMAGKLVEVVNYLKVTMESVQQTMHDHDTRIAVLEKRRARR